MASVPQLTIRATKPAVRKRLRNILFSSNKQGGLTAKADFLAKRHNVKRIQLPCPAGPGFSM
jgi:hypothetical protein